MEDDPNPGNDAGFFGFVNADRFALAPMNMPSRFDTLGENPQLWVNAVIPPSTSSLPVQSQQAHPERMMVDGDRGGVRPATIGMVQQEGSAANARLAQDNNMEPQRLALMRQNRAYWERTRLGQGMIDLTVMPEQDVRYAYAVDRPPELSDAITSNYVTQEGASDGEWTIRRIMRRRSDIGGGPPETNCVVS